MAGAIRYIIGLSQEKPAIIEGDRDERGPWVPAVALVCAAALLLAAVAANASRSGLTWAVPLFYVSVALIYFPATARLIHPGAARQERLALLLIVVAALFVIRIIRAPIGFVDHDEFLHWVTANDIVEQGRLFTPNALLPVSPRFPGLEIVTTAISEMSGLSIFASALILLALCRMVFMAALFLTFERIAGSARIASIACVIYMGSSTFLVFDAHFAYESLAVVFFILAFCSDVVSEGTGGSPARVRLAITLPMLAALAVTHHMTAFFAAALFVGVALLKLVQWPAPPSRGSSLAIAAAAIGLPLLWSNAMGHPTSGYLGPVIRDGLREVIELLSSHGSGRQLFVADDGSVAPAWQRYVAVSSVALTCIGLSTGFFRSLSVAGLNGSPFPSAFFTRSWSSSRLLLLTLLTLVYPLSVIFRLTRSGWEIGNRVGPFSFFGVAVVVAIGLSAFCQGSHGSKWRAAILSLAATVLLVGGIISSEGPRILVPSKFEVSADSSSVEPMGIATAKWARTQLGPDNLFASDRINRLLLATYGRQQVATTLQDVRDVSIAFQSERLSAAEVLLLHQLHIEYLLADLRLSTALPAVGVYFDGGVSDRSHYRPVSSRALLKFNMEKSVSRLFDNGYQIVFDVRHLDATR